MKIPAIYVDLHDGLVEAKDLDLQIRAEKNISFRKHDDWMDVGSCQARNAEARKYRGAKRRLRRNSR